MQTGKDFIQKVKLFKKYDEYFKNIKDIVKEYDLIYRIGLIKKRNMKNIDCLILKYYAYSELGVVGASISMFADESQINFTDCPSKSEMLKKLRL